MTTNAEKRVLIAQDVIAQLNTEELISNPGTYLVVGGNPDNLEPTGKTQVRDVLGKSNKCKVCALGACFVSMMRRYNECTVDQLLDLEDDVERSYNFTDIRMRLHSLGVLRPYLLRLFDEDQLKLIEVAYEGIPGAGSASSDYIEDLDDLCLEAHEFHLHHTEYDHTQDHTLYTSLEEEVIIEAGYEDERRGDGSDVLRAIMNNIIENKGTFVP